MPQWPRTRAERGGGELSWRRKGGSSMGGASRAAARQGRPLLPQASNPCPAHLPWRIKPDIRERKGERWGRGWTHPMATKRRRSIPETELRVGARWASERSRRRRRNHARVEVLKTLAMVDGQPGKRRRRPTPISREREIRGPGEGGKSLPVSAGARRSTGSRVAASPGSVSWRLGSG